MAERTRGRPPTPILTQRLIVEQALETLSRHGLAQFSMAKIAKALRVQTPALYNHVASRAALIGLMRDRVASNIDGEPFAVLPWYDAIPPWARSYRAAFAPDPELAVLLAITPIAESHRPLEIYETIVVGLQDGGWPVEECVSVIVALENFIIGSAFDLVAGATSMRPGDARADVPRFARAYDARDALLRESGRTPADVAFDIGIEALTHGLRQRLADLTRDGETRGPG